MFKTLEKLRLLTWSRFKETKQTPTAGRHAIKFNLCVAALMLMLIAGQGMANAQRTHAEFVNVVDSTQGYSGFSQFPAINARGSVAFAAFQDDGSQGVFQWDRRQFKTIASTTGTNFAFFTDDVVINSAGLVGFRATFKTGGRAAGIFTSDGVSTKTIINTAEQGLPGPGLGSPSINASGTVAFQAARNFFRSGVIFTGDGSTLTPVLDSLNSNFGSFGNVAINAAGEIVFRGVRPDRSEGVFLFNPNQETEEGGSADPGHVIDVTDSNFFQFGDPVINDAGIVADFGGVAAGAAVFTGNAKGTTARNDPSTSFLEHPSINNRGAVAFSAIALDGTQSIFAELTGGASPVTVLQSGDSLFGSTVTAVSVGRFALNDHLRLVFEYELADGRSGIAIASLQLDKDGQ
jgi:hypothetical protein